ncbi:MAG: stage II sporulation protein R [Oscillospiraceae bacterium]|jgi:stage II sporulation protein R|nr:stage II sporulation protein R [Oscillospiraceae bacterium]
MRHRTRARPWEIALAVGLVLAVTTGHLLDREAAALSEHVLRLHVVAHTDDPADQAVKLKVRDRVLACAAPLVAGAADPEEAAARLRVHLPALEAEARAVLRAEGFDLPARAELTEMFFPTKTYPGFSLPAGSYDALRVTLGDGNGQNWWCVVFPPLCLAASGETVTQTALTGGLTPAQTDLITGRDASCVFKFKCLEWWAACQAFFSN